MEELTADDVATITNKVATYGGQLASALHNYGTSAKKVPRWYDGAVNILDATVTTLHQVSSHLKNEAEFTVERSDKHFLSYYGLTYVRLLSTECAATFVKIAPIIAEGCLNRKELKAKRKSEKRAVTKNGEPKIDVDALSLDVAEFLEVIEKAKWNVGAVQLGDVLDRLYNIQVHLLLVHQVVSLGRISSTTANDKVNIKSIVNYHDRILRTADLIGVKAPGGQSASSRRAHDSSSDSDSDSSLNLTDTSSSSDDSSINPIKPKKKSQLKSAPLRSPVNRGPPAPPPPPPPPPNWLARPPPNISPLKAASSVPRPPIIVMSDASSDTPHPPAYSESSKSGPPSAAPIVASPVLVGTGLEPTKPVILSPQNPTPTLVSTFPPEKGVKETEITDQKDVTKPITLEPRLFNSSHGIGFKFKSLFRSKESLAEEMKKTLSHSDSHLRAFVLRGLDLKPIPHSAFHSLEATHMRTILSQLGSNTWYNTFITLSSGEHETLNSLLHPWAQGKIHDRDLVVLKVVQESKLNAWMLLLRDILQKHPAPFGSNDRVILAIVREKLVDGKPLPAGPRGAMYNCGPPPPPPPPPLRFAMPLNPAVRPPPGLPAQRRRTTISDLARPPPPPPPSPPPFGAAPVMSGGPPSPSAAVSPAGIRNNPICVSGTSTLTDYDATQALTTFNEYTLSVCVPPNPSTPRSWARATITQESTERHLIAQRVQSFQQKRGDVIEQKLRMTDQQNSQISRLMDELQAYERDFQRFQWCWVEISLYNHARELANVPDLAATATTIHLVAKRMPRASCKPVELYNSLMAGPPHPQLLRPQPPSPPTTILRPPPLLQKKKGGKKRCIIDSSDSDSSASDSSVQDFRRMLRRDLAKRVKRKAMAKRKGKRRRNADSETESDSEDEEDIIEIKLNLKRGDDVVKKLLEMWTWQGESKVKAKVTV